MIAICKSWRSKTGYAETVIQTEDIDFDVTVHYVITPGEKRTWDHPGCAATCEVQGFDVTKVWYIDEELKLVSAPAFLVRPGRLMSRPPTPTEKAAIAVGLRSLYEEDYDFQDEMHELCFEEASHG